MDLMKVMDFVSHIQVNTPEEKIKFLKYCAGLAFSYISYGAFVRMARNKFMEQKVAFKDDVECMNMDPIIRDAFLSLQAYRKLDKYLFCKAIQSADQLLFLENALLNKEIVATRADKEKAWTLFKLSHDKLNEFQYLIREILKNEHGTVANIFVQKIYKQLQLHYANIINLCSRFNAKDIINQAPKAVENVLDLYVPKRHRRHRKHRHRKHYQEQPVFEEQPPVEQQTVPNNE